MTKVLALHTDEKVNINKIFFQDAIRAFHRNRLIIIRNSDFFQSFRFHCGPIKILDILGCSVVNFHQTKISLHKHTP